MYEEIQILDLRFKPYISAFDIEDAVQAMASKIDLDFANADTPPLFICILNGSFIFASDLLRKIKTPSQIEFVRLKSYDGTASTGNLKEIFGLQIDIANREIILIEDIVDTGHTLANFFQIISKHHPKSVRIASLIFKKQAFQKDFKIDYVGFEIENKFIVGYGMDYNEYGRNLPEIYQIV
jgi:hypoxanthine phosphoribosyltransferase